MIIALLACILIVLLLGPEAFFWMIVALLKVAFVLALIVVLIAFAVHS